MDRAEQLRHLPPAYAIALRLHDVGVEDAQIAAALGVDQECVAALLAVGRAKAARIARLPDVARAYHAIVEPRPIRRSAAPA
jgi:hypothetical protein